MTDFEKIHSFESLYNAYRKARQGKRWKGAAAKFEVNLLEALNLLSAQIRTKRYTMSPYNTFEVYEPKRRVVMSNSYKDKVVLRVAGGERYALRVRQASRVRAEVLQKERN